MEAILPDVKPPGTVLLWIDQAGVRHLKASDRACVYQSSSFITAYRNTVLSNQSAIKYEQNGVKKLYYPASTITEELV